MSYSNYISDKFVIFQNYSRHIYYVFNLLDNDQILAELIQEISKLFCSDICTLVNSEKYKRGKKTRKKEVYNIKKNFQYLPCNDINQVKKF